MSIGPVRGSPISATHWATRCGPALYDAAASGRQLSYRVRTSCRYAVPSRILSVASDVNVGIEAGMPRPFATAVAVGGISCIRPRAPDELTAPMSKLLSCRMMPSENDGSGGAAGLYGAGQPRCGRGMPSRPMRRATNTAPSGSPACAANAAVSARSAGIGASSSIRSRKIRARCGSPQAISHAAARSTSCPAKASTVSCVQLGSCNLAIRTADASPNASTASWP